MGHTQAEKLLEKIKRTLSPLDPKRLLQISMDGPMVNWKFLRIFQEDKSQADPDAPKMINLGLHVVHGSFQNGEKETGWKMGDVLRALWQLFHDSPARRDDFIETAEAIFIQTDAPMVPFLAKELQSTLRGLLSRYIKREELEKTPVQLLKLDPQDKAMHAPLKQLDMGFATKQALEKASEKLQETPTATHTMIKFLFLCTLLSLTAHEVLAP
ncbi:hypothetical protein SKAU_G00137840 [Synaphobranchus kaupii]|uniref:Uncharacterized protein n=1 Tax=Synaphobranchus kaupii TaxID=118154 RepID=A0A9Q1J3Y9_SYNKA|nr:hypothetical protein SKAU_G00137840 [Synaphobranchus kaupii]